MKCMNCGAEIPEGSLHCEACGEEVQIVPDYNPLDDVLQAQVKDSIYEYHGIDDESSYANRESKRRARPVDDRTQSRRTAMTNSEERKRPNGKKRKTKRAKRKKKLIILAVVLVILALAAFLFYQNSYAGQVKKGYSALDHEQYEKAAGYFNKALSKDEEKADAYTGLSKVYIAQDDLKKAENVFTNAIKDQPSNVDLYEAAIQFYTDTEQMEKITDMLEECTSDSVLRSLKAYISSEPEFSLDGGEYEEVQEVTLSTKEKSIYYTIDGSEPTTSSTKYSSPIKLDEGTTTIKAISVNKKGVPSVAVEQKYTIQLPIEDAPKVSPSTGQYEEAMQIEIKVPEGYEAYYTMDGTDPDESSKKYKGPIDMPTGNTVFCAVLVSKDGRLSDITKRNYDLSIE